MWYIHTCDKLPTKHYIKAAFHKNMDRALENLENFARVVHDGFVHDGFKVAVVLTITVMYHFMCNTFITHVIPNFIKTMILLNMILRLIRYLGNYITSLLILILILAPPLYLLLDRPYLWSTRIVKTRHVTGCDSEGLDSYPVSFQPHQAWRTRQSWQAEVSLRSLEKRGTVRSGCRVSKCFTDWGFEFTPPSCWSWTH